MEQQPPPSQAAQHPRTRPGPVITQQILIFESGTGAGQYGRRYGPRSPQPATIDGADTTVAERMSPLR